MGCDFSDLRLHKCACPGRLCEQFKQSSFLSGIIVLATVVGYCSLSVVFWLRRSGLTYEDMAQDLLQGTPRRSKDAQLYITSLETMSTFDKLNRMHAVSGALAAYLAILLLCLGPRWEKLEIPGPAQEKNRSSVLRLL
jgi:hypothetical protein